MAVCVAFSFLPFTHLQEMSQHHVHVHVLLLPPAAHEAQVLSAGDGARLQRLLLSLQERLHRQRKLGGVLEHLCQQRGAINSNIYPYVLSMHTLRVRVS